jgi:TPR repeat protein
MYYRGMGVARDPETAAEWFEKAARSGLANAQVNLGASYERGEGVAQDHQKAEQWYRLAAKQGSEEARQGLARLGAE